MTEVVVRLGERTYSPVLRAADLPTVTVPWWGRSPSPVRAATRQAKVGLNSLFENPS